MRLHRYLGIIVALLLLLPACHRSDAERAERERAAYQKEIEKASSAVTPYRFIKIVARASKAQERPQELEALAAQLRKLQELEAKNESLLRDAEEVARMAVMLYEARKLLENRDEDAYPLLWTALTDEPVPGPWYDAGAEHLVLAALWEFVNMAPLTGKPMDSAKLHAFAHYELARAVPGPAWSPEFRLQVSLVRGLLFYSKAYHFAADEELTRYIEGFKRIRPDQMSWLKAEDREQGYAMELSAGYFLRAGNRLRMGRDEQAADDFEEGLRLTKGIAGENELTLWASAFVAFKRGRFVEAGQGLEKLAVSPYLEPETRERLLAEAKRLEREEKGADAFKQVQTGAWIVRALVARAGGPEKALAGLVGEEQARRLYRPVASLVQVQQAVSLHADPRMLADKATQTGSSLWAWIRGKVGWGNANP